MQLIEKFISPLIEEQFPEFYKEEGELFILFVKAYYEWMENSLQTLVLEDASEFNVNDIVEQEGTFGKIIVKTENEILVEISEFGTFRCNLNCDTLVPLSGPSGTTNIISTRRVSPLYWARHLPEMRDIDRTIERFILQFKNKYLPNIQFTTATNKELFIKNSLDFYRAKGTPRAVDLFFKLVHGFGADVYYPSDDLFRPSDNTWVDVKYIEVSESEFNVNFVGQTVFGFSSGASAFVERFVRIKKGTLFIPVLFITNLRGNFQTGEQIFTVDLENNVTTQMTGSLTTLKITFSDPNFEIGEDVIVTDGRGKNAKARVRAITNLIGAVDFELIDGGWGYIERDNDPTNFYEGSNVLGSSRVLQLSSYSVSNTEFYYHVDPFRQFETVRQDALSIELSNGEFEVGENVFGYSNTDDLLFEGTVTEISTTNNAHVIVYDGRLYNSANALTVDTVGDLGNGIVLTIDAVNDVSATGNVISFSDQLRYEYSLANGNPLSEQTRLRRNDRIVQEVKINNIIQQTANAVVDTESANLQLGQFFVDVVRNEGIIRNEGVAGSENENPIFIRKSDGVKYKIENTSNVNIGIIDTTNLFYVGHPIYAEESGAEAIVAGNFGFSEPASFRIESVDQVNLGTIPVSRVSLRTIEETMQSNGFSLSESDYLVQYVDGQGNIIPVLNAGFNTPLSELGAFTYHSFGSINQIAVTSPGSGYPIDPFFIAYEPNTAVLSRYDFVFQYSGAARGFRTNEIVREFDTDGNPTGFSARIVRHDILNRTLFAVRTHLPESLFNEKCFRKGNSIRGDLSNASAALSYVNERRKKASVGLNAKIRSEAFTGEGVATEIEVINSGFGYQDFNPDIPGSAEVLRLVSERDSNKRIEAEGYLGRQGISEGFHLNRKSFLSSDKYLQDSDFYQEYSYQILTALPFNVYKKTLIDVFHVAGTKPFGLYVATSENEIDIIPDVDISFIRKLKIGTRDFGLIAVEYNEDNITIPIYARTEIVNAESSQVIER